MKKIGFLFLICCFLFCGIVNAEEIITKDRTAENRYGIPKRFEVKQTQIDHALMTPYINPTEKVYDFANLFEIEDLKELKKETQSIVTKENYEIVIVTINDLDSRSVQEYADDFYDYNEFQVNGILLLISLQSRDIYISTSGKGQILFDNDRVDTMIQKITPYLSNKNYKSGADSFLKQIKNYIDLGPSKQMSTCEITNEMGDYICKHKVPIIWIIPICSFIALLITWLITKRYQKIILASNANWYLKSNDLEIKNKIDQFLHTSTARIKIPSSHSSGGGSHHGSSGSSHGGGGGKF